MATITKGKTFISGETVEPDDMHQLVDNATVTNIVNADIASGAAIALSKLATGALPAAITTTTANIVDGSVTPAKLSQAYALATAQNSTSGTNIDFTGIPSWANRITVMFNGVSTNGLSGYLFRVGVGGSFISTGYSSGIVGLTNAVVQTAGNSNGFFMSVAAASRVHNGQLTLQKFSSSAWVASGMFYDSTPVVRMSFIAGQVTGLSGGVDSLRILTQNNTDTFNAGAITIAYEG